MKILVLLWVVLLVGCANAGPNPDDPQYAKAVEKIPAVKNAEYMAVAHWYPNVLLGDFASFNAVPIEGRLFATPDTLVFSVFDLPSKRFLPTNSIDYSAIDWITWKEHGLSNILRFQAENSINSFLFNHANDSSGQSIENSVIQNYITKQHQAIQ